MLAVGTYIFGIRGSQEFILTNKRIQAYKDINHVFGIAVTDATIKQWLTAQEDAALTLKQKSVFAILSHTVEALVNLEPYTS